MANNPRIEDQAIVFFDGVCALCNHTVDFLISRDQEKRLRFAPLQGQTATQLLTEQERNLDSIVFRDGGRTWKSSSAIVRIFWRIGGIWSLVGSLIWVLPKPIREFAYRTIARLRYRLFGKRETCRMPTETDRNLILE